MQDLSSQARIKPIPPPALEGEVLTIGPPGKSPSMLSYLAPRVCNLLCVLSHYRQEVLEDRNMLFFCTVLTCILSGTTIHCPNRTTCPGECLTLTENDIECLVQGRLCAGFWGYKAEEEGLLRMNRRRERKGF